MRLQIFDVEHGACALLTTDDGKRLMIDCGHNATTGWKPGAYLRQNFVNHLDALAITNYDEDHVSGFPDLQQNVFIASIWRNISVLSATIRKLKSDDGKGPGIDHLFYTLDRNFGAPGADAPVVFQGVEYRQFCTPYPRFDDENNLSMALFIKCYGKGVLFPGDLERAGWLELLKRDDFKQALRETSVLVASHHGRENGCCEEIFAYCSPFYVVISDKGYMYDTQKTIPFYRRFTKGGSFRNETRHVLTTRNDGRVAFNFFPQSWGPE